MALMWELFSQSNLPEDWKVNWDNLVQLHHQDLPTLGSTFIEGVLLHFADKVTLATYRKNDQVVMMVLLRKTNHLCLEVFKPSQSPVSLVVYDRHKCTDIQTIFKTLPMRYVRLDMKALDPWIQEECLNLKGQRLNVYATNITTSLEGDFDTFWQNRPKNLRKNINRYINKLDKDFSFENKMLTEPSAVITAVHRYGLIESSGWKGKNGTAIHPSNTQGSFYTKLLSDYCIAKRAFVFETCVNGQAIASRLCLHNDNTVIVLKTTFDENFKQYAPGKLNLYFLLQELFNKHAFSTLDYYTNASKDQKDWSSNQRQLFSSSLYRIGIVKTLENALRQIRSWKK